MVVAEKKTFFITEILYLNILTLFQFDKQEFLPFASPMSLPPQPLFLSRKYMRGLIGFLPVAPLLPIAA